MVVGFYKLNKSLNFSKQNLQGSSFKGQNLAGANFSGCDIRGVDFTGANLTKVDFSYTKAGLNNYWVVISFLLSLILGFFVGAIAALICSFLCSSNSNDQIAGGIVLAGCISFLIISVVKGFANAFINVLGILAVFGIFAGIISVAFNQVVVGNISIFIATNVSLSIISVVLITIFISFLIALTSTKTVTSSLISAILTATSIPLLAKSEIAVNIAQKGWLGITITLGITVLIMLLCAMISRRILAGDENYTFIRRIAIATAAISGTSFRGANLTGANFTNAILRNTDFRKADLTHTIWHQAKKIELARLDNTILDNPIVRDLLISKIANNNSYENVSLEGANLVDLDLKNLNLKNANLSKANLTGAKLSKTDLTEANLIQANLQAACLEESILTKTQAIGTDFSQADFTGARGLGNWNIDSTTKLDRVNCRFVYLGEKLKIGEESERRPQSGEFAPGEFTKLFQVVINTVDLIFRHGLNVEALSTALKDVQTKNQNIPLKIQSIENKGDGFVVVKVNVPQEVDRAKIHSQLKQSYEHQLTAIEAKYRAELQGKQEQIEIYRQKSSEMAEIAKLLAKKDSQASQIQVRASKLVVLTIGEGDFASGFPVTALIRKNDHPLPMTFTGKLPPEPKIPQFYQQWRQLYRSQKWFGRISFDEEDSVTNFSEQELNYYAHQLEECVNNWLNSQSFRAIERELRSKLIPTEEVPVIIQTKDIQVQQIPWHLWDFFGHYQQAEVALSLTGDRKEKTAPPRNQIRILTILGNSTGIDVEADRQVLENLLDAETVFLVEPSRKELHKFLWDEQGWDILCYSGHSYSQADGSTGAMLLNQSDSLTIKELKHGLTKAIGHGLQLAIFNSCDGLGLARQLADLHIPQMIVMREPVPDKVAQEFLKYFLTKFSSGNSLYSSVREARERLEALEDEFPCATWLPVIFQNSAEVGMSW
ncbi:MAG: pentapeptide repeat-containing protein [Cyanobacteria bacterium P01_A01_bin.68]